MPWEAIRKERLRANYTSANAIPIDEDLHREGLRRARRYRLSVYDGLIVAAALRADCETLYTEDMHHGLVIDGRLRIVNPFSPS